MRIKELKKYIEDMPDEREVFIVTCNDKQQTVLRYTNPCCNDEHQEKRNELWLTGEGLLKK